MAGRSKKGESGPLVKKAKVSPKPATPSIPVPSDNKEPSEKEINAVKKALQSQINGKLEWKSSFKSLKRSGEKKKFKAIAACPNPHVLRALFGAKHIEAKKKGALHTVKIENDEEVDKTCFKGKEYRYGASASLSAPLSASLKDGILSVTFSFHVW
jgi:hypothetical protein